MFLKISLGFGVVIKGLVLGGWNARIGQELFGEGFASFEGGSRFIGSKDRQATAAEEIDDAFYQGGFGTHYCEVDGVVFGKCSQFMQLVDSKWDAFRVGAMPGLPGAA
ncbi:hypothetical protein KDK_26970 [Dictyobacter kobayashii]|uniref:Uncharacterized protein n=1 Tax=Dictyobacter kobayashii TaxID=2014872 RepID=A0A402AIF1_9CHLR|nr:hypothetical protein KDK_26970 [Dictyobacter kobayashii]